ncbi:MAG: FkbM family methyltransferase [Verrucomicrobiota bacterium]
MKSPMRTQFFVGHLGKEEAELLKSILCALEGVESVACDDAQGRVVVSYSPDAATPLRLREAVASVGFHPSDVPIEEGDMAMRATLMPAGVSRLAKRAAGKWLFHICNVFPPAKRPLSCLGMRVKKEWLGNCLARVQIPGGTAFKLASIGDNYLSFQVFWKGAAYYEPITSLVLRELIRPGDTFVDVGANVGFFSLLLSAQKPGLRVIAFEPNPKNHDLLVRNSACNGFRNIVCEPVALADAAGTAPLYLTDSDMSASLRSDFAFHERPPIQVRTLPLDSYLKSRPLSGRLTLKVDVEGAEDAFFRGAHDTIVTHQPDIIVEVAIKSVPAYQTFLRRLGYRFYPITDQGLLPAEELRPVVKENLLFLNYLLSARPPEVLAELFERIRPEVQKIDLTQTSKCVDADHIHRALYGPLTLMCSAFSLIAAN